MNSPAAERSIRTPSYVLLCAAAFTASWTGLRIGPIQPVDWLLVVCAGLSLTSFTRQTLRPPRWILAPALAILIVLTLQRVHPTDSIYLFYRFQLDAAASLGAVSQTPTVAAAQWLVALVALPMVAVAVLAKTNKPVAPLLWWWAAGAVVSAAVSVSDFYGLTAIGPSRLDISDAIGGRQPGLASHANNLGFACALSAPIVLYYLTRGRRRPLHLVMLAALLGGVVVSGSRGCQAGFALAVLFALVYSPAGRRLLPVAIYAAAWVSVMLLIFTPNLTSGFGTVLRFNQNKGAESDYGRALIAQQGLADFRHNPLYGIGLDHLTEAHSIFIQLIATGGVLLAAGFAIFITGMIRTLMASRAAEPIAAFLVVSIAVWMVSGSIENQLTDRYLYFPVAAAVVLAYRLRARQTQALLPDGSGATASVARQRPGSVLLRP